MNKCQTSILQEKENIAATWESDQLIDATRPREILTSPAYSPLVSLDVFYSFVVSLPFFIQCAFAGHGNSAIVAVFKVFFREVVIQ